MKHHPEPATVDGACSIGPLPGHVAGRTTRRRALEGNGSPGRIGCRSPATGFDTTDLSTEQDLEGAHSSMRGASTTGQPDEHAGSARTMVGCRQRKLTPRFGGDGDDSGRVSTHPVELAASTHRGSQRSVAERRLKFDSLCFADRLTSVTGRGRADSSVATNERRVGVPAPAETLDDVETTCSQAVGASSMHGRF